MDCILTLPYSYVKVLSPPVLQNVVSHVEIGSLQTQLVEMRSYWSRVDP